jgi:hypothetical protein
MFPFRELSKIQSSPTSFKNENKINIRQSIAKKNQFNLQLYFFHQPSQMFPEVKISRWEEHLRLLVPSQYLHLPGLAAFVDQSHLIDLQRS